MSPDKRLAGCMRAKMQTGCCKTGDTAEWKIRWQLVLPDRFGDQECRQVMEIGGAIRLEALWIGVLRYGNLRDDWCKNAMCDIKFEVALRDGRLGGQARYNIESSMVERCTRIGISLAMDATMVLSAVVNRPVPPGSSLGQVGLPPDVRLCLSVIFVRTDRTLAKL